MEVGQGGRGNESENQMEESRNSVNPEEGCFVAFVKCTAQQRQPVEVVGNVISTLLILNHPQTLLQSNEASLGPITSLCCSTPLTLE